MAAMKTRQDLPKLETGEFEEMVAAWRRLDRSDLPHDLVPLGPGEEQSVRNDLVARPFRSPHTAPCQGYVIWSTRQKLLPEYHGLPPGEIARLRRSASPNAAANESDAIGRFSR